MESSIPTVASDLLIQGMELMLVGMGTVFVFLTVLVAATKIMSRVVRPFVVVPGAQKASPEEVAVVAAAIAQHRRQG